jgi:hypothetical protein
MYEHHREREGIAGHHALGKNLLAGFAAAKVDNDQMCHSGGRDLSTPARSWRSRRWWIGALSGWER